MSAQTFFILNADLDVHTGREDLEALAERVRSELAWVVPNPQLHMFSALYHLIDQLGRGVSRKESRMLKLWREDKKLAAVTEAGFSSFKEDFGQRISGRRARVLLGSGLSRLSMVAGSISDAVHARIRFMDDNLADLKSYAGRLKSRHIALQAALGTLANAITGLSDSIRLELSESVDRYFDPDRGRIVRETLDMVDNYPIEEQNLKALTDFRGLLQRLYRFYLEFRQSLSRYLVERVNLRVIEFAKEREAFLEQRLTESYRAFWSLFAAALGDYRRELAELKIELRNAGAPRDGEWPAIEKLALPTFSAFVDREGVGRGVILMKFGIGRVTRFLTGLKAGLGKQNEILRREAQDEETIREAVELVKAEASTELLRAFREYGGRFKTGYLFRILDRSTLNLLSEFKTRAEMTRLDFENLLKQSDSEGEERKSFMSALKKTGQIAEAMTEELEELRCAVNLEWLHRAEGASPEAKEPAE